MNAGGFRLRAPAPPEQDLHEQVAWALTCLVKPPAEWTCFPAGNVQLPAHAAAKLARMGLKRGWPDFLIVSNAFVHGIELKRKGGALSRTYLVRTRRGTLRVREGQQDVFPRLQQAGMRLAVCHSLDEVLRQLRLWEVPLRETLP